jgi:molybdenum cofactor synthesis domain-containing protein
VSAPATAAIVTIGNEIVSGDVLNTNASWLAKRLEGHGVEVQIQTAIRDEIPAIVTTVNALRAAVDVVIVTGGLGGTPDDITREALAATFGVGQAEVPALAAALRARFSRHPEYAARFANLPVGSRPLRNPPGGAPGFALENVWVLPGLPSEMEAMFDEVVAAELPGAASGPIRSWRRKWATNEGVIVTALEEFERLHPVVGLGSYPAFHADGHTVELVLKSRDEAALAAAAAWLEQAVASLLSR